jgi:hypothetical protein
MERYLIRNPATPVMGEYVRMAQAGPVYGSCYLCQRVRASHFDKRQADQYLAAASDNYHPMTVPAGEE